MHDSPLLDDVITQTDGSSGHTVCLLHVNLLLQLGAEHYQAASQFLAAEAQAIQSLAASRGDMKVEVTVSADTS